MTAMAIVAAAAMPAPAPPSAGSCARGFRRFDGGGQFGKRRVDPRIQQRDLGIGARRRPGSASNQVVKPCQSHVILRPLTPCQRAAGLREYPRSSPDPRHRFAPMPSCCRMRRRRAAGALSSQARGADAPSPLAICSSTPLRLMPRRAATSACGSRFELVEAKGAAGAPSGSCAIAARSAATSSRAMSDSRAGGPDRRGRRRRSRPGCRSSPCRAPRGGELREGGRAQDSARARWR